MKISLVVAFTLCLAGSAGAQQTPICIVDGVQQPCAGKAAATQQAPGPLCIIDGIRYPSGTVCKGDLANTNQVFTPGVMVYNGTRYGYRLERGNVVHIEVIKGPAAISQYGPDAANGVVLITTDRGPVPQLAADDPLARFLYPPELVMAHQQEIKLTDAQRFAIQRAIVETQGLFVDLKFKVAADVEKLQRLVEPSAVDQAKVMEQIDRVLAGEREIKRAQLTLMIRVKNQLTEQQQASLGKLR